MYRDEGAYILIFFISFRARRKPGDYAAAVKT
jgi:hypothetical protein